MLKTPSFVDTLWHALLLPAVQVRCVEHAYLNSLTKLLDQRYQQGSAGGFWILPSTSKGICQDRNLKFLIVLERLPNNPDQFGLSLPNVEG